jgi:hypothetical protein
MANNQQPAKAAPQKRQKFPIETWAGGSLIRILHDPLKIPLKAKKPAKKAEVASAFPPPGNGAPPDVKDPATEASAVAPAQPIGKSAAGPVSPKI